MSDSIDKEKMELIKEIQGWITQALRQKRLVLTKKERNSAFVDYIPRRETNEMIVEITAGMRILARKSFKCQWPDLIQ
jgi:hypothetical protein